MAILGATDVHLIEANRRKAEFLRETARATGTQVTVHPVRAESARPLAADVVVARGCAPLDRLLGLAERHLAGDGFGLFLKGKGVDAELSQAGRRWKMQAQRFPSCTERSSGVLKIEGLALKFAANQ